MILDHLDLSARYHSVHPGFEAAFRYLRERRWEGLPAGRHETGDPRLYLSIDIRDARGREAAELEHHRRYIDIQYTVSGHEVIGWQPIRECRTPKQPFDTERDFGLFVDRPSCWIHVPPSCFAVFYPDDTHAPLGGEGALHKIIMKVAVDW